VKASYSFVLALLTCATTSVLANSPASNKVRAAAQPSAELSTENATVTEATISHIPSGAGTHIQHVASAVMACNGCVETSNNVNVPSNATQVAGIQALTSWQAVQDGGGTGSASGTTGIVSNPALSGTARQFETSYTNGGSERFYATFGTDAESTHFVYDGYIYIASPSNDVANIEMDINQVIANGDTVIIGFQCDGYSKTWDYTANTGTPQNPTDSWLHSSAACNPQSWSTNAWHHVQISYSRDDAGNVTYESVWLDGAQQTLNVTVNSAFALGWGAGALVTNFQIDGYGASGTTNVYLDNLTISRW
jgi:hypothetical protein